MPELYTIPTIRGDFDHETIAEPSEADKAWAAEYLNRTDPDETGDYPIVPDGPRGLAPGDTRADTWRDRYHPEKKWIAELTKVLMSAGYVGGRLWEIVDHVIAWGTAEALPDRLLTYPSDRAMIERRIPPAPFHAWAAFDGVWNLVETAEGRRWPWS